MKVLVADDSDLVRQRLRLMLSEIDGVELTPDAHDGEEAESAIKDLEPDVVILDIRMPHMDGLKVLRTLQRSEARPEVIVLTNYPYPQYQQQCRELGARHFFNKSTEFEEISDVLKTMLSRNGKRVTASERAVRSQHSA